MSKVTRRNTLKGLVFTVPTVWSVPLVQSVLLPAHAQTSVPEDRVNCLEFGIRVEFTMVNIGPTSMDEFPTWGGGANFTLWDEEGNIYFDGGVPMLDGLGEVDYSFTNLPERDFYFSSVGGWQGETGDLIDGSVTISCCSDSESVDPAPAQTLLDTALEMFAIITIDSDECNVRQVSEGELPPVP